MQILTYQFPADQHPTRRVHVGVVASGDVEILLEATDSDGATVRVRTSVDGFDTVWRDVLQRFFNQTPLAGSWELNDSGATPGVVALRLRQAAETALAGSS